MRTALPNAKLLTMHPAKHFGLLEYDLQFATAVNDFCKEQFRAAEKRCEGS